MRDLFKWRDRFSHQCRRATDFYARLGVCQCQKCSLVASTRGWNTWLWNGCPGCACGSFGELSPGGLQAYGRHLAALHTHFFPKNGTLAGDKGRPAADFRTEVFNTLQMLFERFYKDQPEHARIHGEMLERAWQIQAERCAPVLVDLSASQYLRSEQGELCALVDTDAYAIGPRELDFILLEYFMTMAQAREFSQGYQEVLALPILREVRQVYRYLYLLMEVEGAVPLERWMDARRCSISSRRSFSSVLTLGR